MSHLFCGVFGKLVIPCALFVALGSGCGKSELQVIPVDGKFDGKSYSELSAAWWQWAFSMPLDAHPLVPNTQRGCETGQQGSVWFLGGSFNKMQTNKVTASRDCKVPAGKALYFPILNGPAFDDEKKVDAAGLRAILDETFKKVISVSAELDGAPVLDLVGRRHNSVVFSFTSPANAPLGVSAGTHTDVVDSGYYLLLDPPQPGSYNIHFNAAVALGSPEPRFELDIAYKLTVE